MIHHVTLDSLHPTVYIARRGKGNDHSHDNQRYRDYSTLLGGSVPCATLIVRDAGVDDCELLRQRKYRCGEERENEEREGLRGVSAWRARAGARDSR